MRTTLALATAATAAITGLTAAPQALATTEPDGTTRSHESGIVLECTGAVRGLRAYAALYENDAHANYLQVVLDDGAEHGTSREPADLWRGDRVRTGLRLDGAAVRITGTARAVGPRTAVHEEIDDDNQRVVSDGTHRRLRHRLTLRWQGRTVPLTCNPAFRYDLQVTRTPIIAD